MTHDDKQEVLIELFSMLKDSINEDKDATQKLINQQFELVTQIKSLPMKELKESIKDHAKKSEHDIDECTDTVNTKTEEILDIVKNILSKINKMFWVIGLVITILSAGYFIVKATVDNESTFKKWKQEITDERQETINELRSQIIDEIKKLHQDNSDEVIP